MNLIHKTVRKSNALVEASYRLSVYEQRIILACISQIGRNDELTDQVSYRVSAAEIAKAAGVTPQAAYQRVREAAERLWKREVTITQSPNGGGLLKAPTVVRWIQSRSEYSEGDAFVELQFSQKIIPYLTELSREYTKYKFGDVSQMSSGYAVRLYEMLVQWDGVGKREAEVAWLKESLQVGDKYPAMKDFKKWVLQPSVDQVNKHSPLNVEWTQRKTGRSVTHIIFSFSLKEPKAAPKKIPEDKKPHDRMLFGYRESVLTANARPGETFEMVAKRLRNDN